MGEPIKAGRERRHDGMHYLAEHSCDILDEWKIGAWIEGDDWTKGIRYESLDQDTSKPWVLWYEKKEGVQIMYCPFCGCWLGKALQEYIEDHGAEVWPNV